MRKPSVKCALLAAMIAKHKWGTPIAEDALLAIAAIDQNDYPAAREVFDDLRSEPYITSQGSRGIKLDRDTSAYPRLPVSEERSDALSEPRSEQAGVERTPRCHNPPCPCMPGFLPFHFHSGWLDNISLTVERYGTATMGEVTKTLELKLVDPNTHKERKLRESRKAYQQALQAAFAAGCDTQSAANDVVVEYDLSGYAKNALKKYVPQLHTSYDADELHDDHPVRFTNEGPQLDHQPRNAIEWYVKIPHYEDYHLWIPVRANPDQWDWLEALYAGDAEMGESRLFERDGTWYLHLTATRNVEDHSEASTDERTPPDESGEPCLARLDRTPIGVDIGEASLVTVCHRDEHGSPVRPELWADDGKAVRRLRKTYVTATRRLQKRGSERIAASYGDALWDRIDDVFHRVTREVVEHAESVENSVLVLEDLTYIREHMDYGAYMNRRLHGWGFAKLHARIRYKAVEKGIPVETVNPRNTSKACHACGDHGSRPRQATFRCSNDDCWVGEYQADVNGAINIADRYRSGESHRRSDRTSRQKVGADDSAPDGASLTGPQDSHADAEIQQETRGPYAS